MVFIIIEFGPGSANLEVELSISALKIYKKHMIMIVMIYFLKNALKTNRNRQIRAPKPLKIDSARPEEKTTQRFVQNGCDPARKSSFSAESGQKIMLLR